MTPIADLDKMIADSTPEQLPELIGLFATLHARAQLKLLTGPAPVTRDAEELLTMAEVAIRLSIPESRAYDLARQKKLPAVRIGKYVRVSAQALAEYQARLPKA
jgi:excisionase family DNA binding protein